VKKDFLFLILAFFVWLGRFFFSLESLPTGELVIIEGDISRPAQILGESQYFWVDTIKIKTSLYPQFYFGDKIRLNGKLQQRVINKYYSQYYINYPNIELINRSDSFNVSRAILGLRNRLTMVYKKSLPEPAASLLAGVILGVKTNLPKDFFYDLRSAGLIHVVVASGANVIFVASFITIITKKFFMRQKALWLSLIMIWFYVFLAGAEPPVIRAGVMTTFTYLAGLWGRVKAKKRGLVLAGSLMALWQPTVIFDLGFQLSFAATAGIVFFKEKLDIYLKGIDDLTTTLSAQFLTTPLLIGAFGNFLPLSFIPNALLLWLISPMMIFGFLLGMIGLIYLPLASFLAGIVWVPLQIFIWGAEFFGRHAWQWQIDWPHWLTWFYFSLIMFWVLKK